MEFLYNYETVFIIKTKLFHTEGYAASPTDNTFISSITIKVMVPVPMVKYFYLLICSSDYYRYMHIEGLVTACQFVFSYFISSEQCLQFERFCL